jgi:hypothetical protein
MKHIEEIKRIIDEYARIEKSMAELQQQTDSIILKKNLMELSLIKVREEERLLIDKIKAETGCAPDFYKILKLVNDESSRMV